MNLDEAQLRELIPTRPSPVGLKLPHPDPLRTLMREAFTHCPEEPQPDYTLGPTAQWLAYLARLAANVTPLPPRDPAPLTTHHDRRAS